MPVLWPHIKSIRAAFITRNEVPEPFDIRSITNLPSQSDEKQVLEHNRTVVADYLGWPELQLSMGKQVHGTNVVYTTKPVIHDQTDGLVTDQPGVALSVLVADCAAVLIADPVYNIVAAVHAGWRGAIGGILTEAINKMIRMGSEPDVMTAYISSCISQESFEVGEEVAGRFPARLVDRSRDKPHVDLRGFVLHELVSAGIPFDSVIQDDRCTMQHPDTLHSYRRDGKASGRMMALIAIT